MSQIFFAMKVLSSHLICPRALDATEEDWEMLESKNDGSVESAGEPKKDNKRQAAMAVAHKGTRGSEWKSVPWSQISSLIEI